MKLVTAIAFFGTAAVSLLPGQTPTGWKSIKDKTGVCQMSVPANWTVSPQLPSMATAPDQSDAVILAQPGKIKPMNEVVQKAVGAEKVLENTEDRLFWAGKPTSFPAGAPPVTAYHVTVPSKNGTCVAQIAVKAAIPESEVRKIAATVAPVK